MSWWRRLFGGDSAEEPEAEEEPARDAPGPSRVEPVEDDPERLLERLAEAPAGAFEDDDALRPIEALRQRGRDARAIDLGRRVLAQHPERVALHLRIAEMLASRGDDEGAYAMLSPFVDRSDVALDLVMLMAEIRERRGDVEGALVLYERVVGRDLDYPRARARVRRLREGRSRERDLGATLMADGALARGRYRVSRELGRGGAGTVFLAEDETLGRPVALKVYHRRGRAERERLLIEARMPARFEHPGIVRIFDLDDALAAIAMECVSGGSVRAEMRKVDLPPSRVLRWFATAAAALEHVHARGIVHRDIKPSNMLLRADDRVVLTDFGLAHALSDGDGDAEAGAGGTLAYMPPEQRAGAPAAPSMDIYAFGASLMEVLEVTAFDEPTRGMDTALSALARECMREAPSDRPNAPKLTRALVPLVALDSRPD